MIYSEKFALKFQENLNFCFLGCVENLSWFKKKYWDKSGGEKMKKNMTSNNWEKKICNLHLYSLAKSESRRWKNRLCRMGNQILDLLWAEFHHLFMKSNSGGGKMRVKKGGKKRLKFIIRFPNLPPLSHPSIIGSTAGSRPLGEEAPTVPSHNEVIYILQRPESHLTSLSLRGRRADTHQTSKALSKRSRRWCAVREDELENYGNIYCRVGCRLKATRCCFPTFER